MKNEINNAIDIFVTKTKQSGCTILQYSTSSIRGFQFLFASIYCIVDYIHSSECKIAHCGFVLSFPDD